MIQFPSAIETFYFAGAKAMSGTIHGTAVATVAGYEKPAARITSTAHGLLANTSILIPTMTGYDAPSMRQIVAVDTNTFDVLVPEGFKAWTPAGTETWMAGCVLNASYLLVGFKLHLSAADANGESLSLDIDSNKGSYWDTDLFSQTMTGIQDLVQMYSTPILINGKDLLKFSWTNTGAKTWGLELHVVRRA